MASCLTARVLLVSIGLVCLVFFPRFAWAATGTLVASPALAWSDKLGWINFNPTNGTVRVSDAALTGYAWSQNYGWINLAPSAGGVVNDGQGNLSGFAWGEQLGWIDFGGVTIQANGTFSGDAHGSLVGTLTFSCPNCTVATTWQPLLTALVSGGGSAPVPLPSVRLEGTVDTTSSLLELSIIASQATRMRLGFDLNVLFAPWEPLSFTKTLAIPDYARASGRISVFVQVQNEQGIISPLTPFFFDLTTGQEALTITTTPVFTRPKPQTSALLLGFMGGLMIECPPFITLALPSNTRPAINETRKLQFFLRSFLRTRNPPAVNGRYDTLTQQAVTSFQSLFKEEILSAAGLRRATGQVDERTRRKINMLACQARLNDLIKFIK